MLLRANLDIALLPIPKPPFGFLRASSADNPSSYDVDREHR